MQRTAKILLPFFLAFLGGQAMAASCEDVMKGIAAKIEANGVKAYSLDAVPAADVGDRKVVGSCEGGSKKIVYTRK